MKLHQSKQGIIFVGVILSFLFVSANGYVYGQDESTEGQRNKEKWEKAVSEIHKQLGLTPQQEEQLKEHRSTHRSQMKALRQQIKSKREQIKEELQRVDFDSNKVKQIHNELKSLKSQSEDYRLDGILEVRTILTPEQFNKFMELKKNRKGHKKGENWKKRSKRGEEQI